MSNRTSLSMIRSSHIELDINSYDKSAIDKLRLVDELDDQEKKSIFNIIDIAISRKRLKDNLMEVLMKE